MTSDDQDAKSIKDFTNLERTKKGNFSNITHPITGYAKT